LIRHDDFEPAPPPLDHGDSTLERLRRVAAELFATRGYDGTSMADIADRLGLRKASLYNYYPSKEELLLDLFGEALAGWEAASQPALSAPGSYGERLRRHLEAALGFVADHPHQAAVVRLAATQIGGELGKRLERRLEEEEGRYLGQMERLFAQAVAAGEVREGEPRELALVWKVLVDGLLINQLLLPPGKDRYLRRLPRLWTLFWHGLAAGEPAREEDE
jgi:AcrR family transcriptional regulator